MQGIQKCMYMNNLEYMFYEHACHHIHTNSFPQLHFFSNNDPQFSYSIGSIHKIISVYYG